MLTGVATVTMKCCSVFTVPLGRNKKELKAYINRLAEAEKRDHRKINKKLDLYHMQEEAPGSIFWHPKGWSVYSAIEEYMRGKQRGSGLPRN